ncbi:MAG TPA: DUF192 domain-containing protein [Acidimicrobiales bacterium]|nr:DUF192 domain-containing protein [Acidimicrobiales bacterium]
MSKDRRSSSHRRRPLQVAILGWSIVLVLLSGIGAFLAVGANGPPDPRLESPGSPPQAVGVLEFGEIAFRVTPARATGLPATTERCALLADTEVERQKGLMGRSDLGDYDAMIFRFEADTMGTFYMRNVPMALSIAWFDASGRFVSSADMTPCPDQEGCPQYPPAGSYRFALEVQKGGLERLGVATDSVLTLGGACSAPRA